MNYRDAKGIAMDGLRKIAFAALLAALSLSIGCHDRPAAIAVIPRTTATLLWEPMHLGIAETARGSGLRVYWNAPVDEGDTEKQINLYSAVQAKGYRGIIFAPDETLAARSIVLQTVKSGTPVVIVDDELGPRPGPLLSYVSSDEEAGATLAAQRLAHILQGRGAIAIIGINPRSEGALSREGDFEKALALAAPNIRVAVRRYGDSVVTHQQQIAQEIMDRADRVDAIAALTSTATRGAYYAKLANEPRSHIFIVGFDQDLLLPLQTGDVDSVIVQDTREIGRIAVRNLQAEMQGEKVDGSTLVPPILLTRDKLNAPAIMRLWEFPLYRWSDM
jgi:ribose transport system substrate-binding protein